MPDHASPSLLRIALLCNAEADVAHLRDTLHDHAEIAYAASAANFDPERLAQSRVGAALVSLGSDAWPTTVVTALDAAGIAVVYDDPAASRALEGWARTRWLRHLLAKLQGSIEVDPTRPGPPRQGEGPQASATANTASEDVAGQNPEADTAARAAMVDARLAEEAAQPESVAGGPRPADAAAAAAEPGAPGTAEAPAVESSDLPKLDVPVGWALIDFNDTSAVALAPASPPPPPPTVRDYHSTGPDLPDGLAGLELVPLDVPGENQPPSDPIERWLHETERCKRAAGAKDATDVKAAGSRAGNHKP